LIRHLEAKDCKDLYKIMRRDFWVVTPCYSVATPGKIMEGTRLTLQVRENLLLSLYFLSSLMTLLILLCSLLHLRVLNTLFELLVLHLVGKIMTKS
jgi:hypothetical protein